MSKARRQRRPAATAAFALVLIASGFARAQSYHLISKVDFGVAFIDADSIRPSDGGGKYWTTLFLFDDGGDGKAGSSNTAFIMTQDEVNCRAEQTRHLNLQSYDARGYPTDSVAAPSDWTPIIPGSNQAVEARLVCDPTFLKADQGLNSEVLPMLTKVRKLRSKF
jgi:hypothetical protein